MEKPLFFILPLLFLGKVLAIRGDLGFVVSSTEPSGKDGKEDSIASNVPQHPEIYEMAISSNISNRFATTLVVSKVKNAEKVAKETTFTVVLPEKAFISEFVMEIGGKSYKAYVKEKEEAKQIYNEAVASGQSAGHVAVSARDSNKFTVSVNIEPESKVVFLLTYEELLQRKNDQYELIININPRQIVKDLNVKVQINETRPLKFVRTPSLRSGNEISKNEDKLNPSSDIQIINSTTGLVKFSPDSTDQKEFARYLGGKESDGLSGQFVVQYDVERDPNGGEVLLQDGYFVHFFAPIDLDPLPKHVLLALDSSGSMGGRKIDQVKDAVNSILKELNEQDLITVLDFGSDVFVWNIAEQRRTEISFDYRFNYEEPFSELSNKDLPGPLPANKGTLSKAKLVIDNLWAGGGTNIIGALNAALYLAKVVQDHPTDKKHQPVIIFLTDGEPNVGVSSTESITNMVTHLNTENNNIPIFSLSFGNGADREFLRKLSSKNQGFSRHIYEAADASLQIQEFYKQISSPLLSNITFKYNDEVKEVTKTKFPLYFKGSEIVVTGRYDNFEPDFKIAEPVACWAREPKVLVPRVERVVTSLERLWAYLTVQQLLNERKLVDNKTELTKKALDLALRYSFVTDVTSLVVVKPNETSRVSTEDAYSGREEGRGSFQYLHGGGSFQHKQYLSAVMPQSAFPNYQMRSAAVASPKGFPGLAAPGSAYIAMDRIYGGPPGPPTGFYQYSSRGDLYAPAQAAPVPPPRLPLPVYNAPTTTTSSPKLVNILPWLASKLNPDGTLTIGQNVYELGEISRPATITEKQCPQTPLNATQTGTCSFLSLCPDVHSSLTDFSVYQQYFCPIDTPDKKYAGVCCPPKTQNLTL